MQTNSIDEQGLTELLYRLTEERLPDGNIPEEAIKRDMRLKEVNSDIKSKLKEGGEFAPTDFIRSYGLLLLFALEYSGFVSFRYQDVFEWGKFKEIFYEYTSIFDEVFDLKKGKGRPSKSETALLYLLGVFCRSHNLPTCDHRYACKCNYYSLLGEFLELRLSRSRAWHARVAKKGLHKNLLNGEPHIRLSQEGEKIFQGEYKAAKMAIDRFWLNLYGKRSPKLSRGDKDRLKQFILENLAL